MIFWHESSATEPGGTARNGRARQSGAANIAATPVAGSVTLFALPPAGRAQRGRSCDHGADRSALSGPALLRLAPDGGMAGYPRRVTGCVRRLERAFALLLSKQQLPSK